MPHGSRGRLEILPGPLPIVGGREIETWEALIHYGVLDSSKDGHGQRLEKQTAGNELQYFYSDGPNVSFTVKKTITALSTKLEDVRPDSDDVNIANAVDTMYKKQERFWADKAQDIVHEYEHGTYNWNPPIIEGR